jgi:hypothetical protein
MIVLRYLFGFRGAPLVEGAIDPSCGRCSAASIEAWLDQVFAEIDVDGNGKADPLTDGVLALRYLLGLRGAALVTGAVDLAGCTRCDARTLEIFMWGLLV